MRNASFDDMSLLENIHFDKLREQRYLFLCFQRLKIYKEKRDFQFICWSKKKTSILWFLNFLTILPCILVIMTVSPSMLFSEEDKFRIDNSKKSISWSLPGSISHCTWIRFGGVSWTVNDKEDGGSKKRNISITDKHSHIVYTRQLFLWDKSHKVYL